MPYSRFGFGDCCGCADPPPPPHECLPCIKGTVAPFMQLDVSGVVGNVCTSGECDTYNGTYVVPLAFTSQCLWTTPIVDKASCAGYLQVSLVFGFQLAFAPDNILAAQFAVKTTTGAIRRIYAWWDHVTATSVDCAQWDNTEAGGYQTTGSGNGCDWSGWNVRLTSLFT